MTSRGKYERKPAPEVTAAEFVAVLFAERQGHPSPLLNLPEFHVIASNAVEIIEKNGKPRRVFPAKPVTPSMKWQGDVYVNWSTACRLDDDDGKGPRVRATKEAFGEQWFLMLDDIGDPKKTCLTMDDPRVQAATYILETSPGSYHVGYAFDTPLGYADSERLRAGCIAANLGDKASMQNPHRWCRVPGSVNMKPAPKFGFVARLVQWHPERRFTLDALIAALDIKLGATASANGKAHSSRKGTDYSKLDAIPDARFQFLRSLKMGDHGSLLSAKASAEGFFPIVCPWFDDAEHGHSGQDQSGGGYRPSMGGDDPPAFACHHSHGQVGLGTGPCGTPEFLRWVDAQREQHAPVDENVEALLKDVPGPGPFPVDDLPAPVAEMVREIARCVQVDPAMPAGHALGLLAACVMKQCRVREKPGLESYLTQFVVTGAESGERKSAVHSLLAAPVDATEAEWEEEDKKSLAAHEAKVATMREEATVKKRTAALKDTSADDKKSLLQEYGDLVRQAKLLEREPPTQRRVYLDDVTEASFVSNLGRGGGAVSLISPEGRGFISTLLGYYSRGEAKDACFLQAYSGDTIKVARQTGGADGGERVITVRDPAASFATMVQGDVVEELNRHIMLERSGFSNRVTYVRTIPMIGRRLEREDDQPFAEDVRKGWAMLVTNLLSHKDEAADPIMLALDEDAQAYRRVFHNALEARCGDDLQDHAGLISKWTTKTSKLAALFALIEECTDTKLHRLLEGEDKKRNAIEVTGEHWLAAQSISEWLLRSTIGVRQIAAALPEEREAKLVLELLQKHQGEWFYPRGIVHQLHRKGVGKVEQALAALGVLHGVGLIEREDGRNVATHRFRAP